MVERYLWTPWDVGSDGTNTWPTDFHRLQDDYQADPSEHSTHNVHSLKGIGRLVLVTGPGDYVADHLTVPGVLDIGSTLTSARAWIEANTHRRAKELLSHFEAVLAPLRKQDPLDKGALLSRFLPDQGRRGLTSRRRGTFTETWTGTDGDPWPADWTNTQLDSLDVFSGGAIATFEIQSNEGAADGPVGSVNRGSGYTMAYNGDEATDMNVACITVERRIGGPAVRIENGGGFDTFYYVNTYNQFGNDTRGYKVIDETRSEEFSSGQGNNTDPRWQRLVVENDGSGDPALDYTEWLNSVSEPGTPTVSHTDTEVDAITGSGFGGIYDVIARDATITYDDFEMTNNDAPAGAVRRRRNLGLTGVGH